MTENKQIKDGIDVSQCECYSIKDNSCSNTLSGSCMKEKCQTFRLLQTIKAKTQEYEELKEHHNKFCQEFEKEKQDLINKYNQLSRDFYSGKYCNTEKCQQLEQLKAENKGIKHQIEVFTRQLANANKEVINEKEKNATLRQKTEQAEQKLEHIRKYGIYMTAFNNANKTNKGLDVKEVIQIIGEVER